MKTRTLINEAKVNKTLLTLIALFFMLGCKNTPKEKKGITQLTAKYLMEPKSLIEYYFQRVRETFLTFLKN